MKSILIICLVSISTIANSQLNSNINNAPISIYYDCNNCDLTFVRQNLQQVEFVRDRLFADIHILLTNQENGSGGRAYTLNFIGQLKFKNLIDTIKFSTNPNMTADEIRRLQLKYIELGMIRYWLKNNDVNTISIEHSTSEIDEIKIEDKWNNWVFSLNLGGWFSGQETNSSSNLNSNISAKHVTEKNKFNLWGNINNSKSTFNYDDVQNQNTQQSMNIYISDVFSLNDHWSYGLFSDARNSIFSNYKISSSIRTGVEYNLFPYSESATKQLLAYYTIGPRYNQYIDTTVFNKTKEILFEHNLLIGTAITQKWGSISGNVSYKNYLHDFTLNSVSFYLNFDVRLFKGFSMQINGSYGIQHNQINLAKSDVSVADVLLQQQQLRSGYNYWFNAGINYAFGSIYNSVVNPRFVF